MCIYTRGSSTFWVRGPIYIFHIILRATVIADYKIIMDILNIIIGAWAARQVKCLCRRWSNPYIASPTSQLIIQSFRCFTHATAHSTTLLPLHLHHRTFYNLFVASPTSQALHVLHLAICPCIGGWKKHSVVTSLLQQVTKFRSSYSFG